MGRIGFVISGLHRRCFVTLIIFLVEEILFVFCTFTIIILIYHTSGV